MFLPIIIVICTMLILVCTKLKFAIQTKSLKDKHVVITGGSSGIGKSVGIIAARQGAHVTILARDENKLKGAKEDIIKECNDPLSQKIQSVSLDVTDSKKVDEILKKIDNETPIFMLVNCAGFAICGTVEDTSISDMKKLFDLNFFGTIYPIKTMIPLMKQRKEGIVVLTASQAALLGIYGLAAYSSTKYALRGLAEALHMELRPYNISVTLSLPPDTDTPGLLAENESKPIETHLISDTAGLFNPDDVAQKLIDDSLNGKFYSYIGFESFMLSTLCCSMSPFVTFGEVVIQALLLGPFRIISSLYTIKFQNIIQKCMNDKENSVKNK